jgi:pilus assembly protein CpaE
MSSARLIVDKARYSEGGYATPGSHGRTMTAAPYLVPSFPDNMGEPLSVAIIGPDDERRLGGVMALRECQGAMVQQYATYPDRLNNLPRILDEQYDVVIVDLDSDPEAALELVESVCAYGKSTVMVYSAQPDPQVLVRCMRAGAREFLTVPFDRNLLAEALVRAAARRPAASSVTRKAGRLLVFMGAKGGVGVTSVACNFAVALAQDAEQKTLLIDLDLPLGDAALNLGIVSEFSTVSALEAADRLDGSFLSSLLVKHSSGLWVLAAPGRFPHFEPTNESLEKLLMVARQEFDNVVIDVGSRLNLVGTALFSEASTVYLVTQAGIPELRNSNRLISQVFAEGGPRLEIVLNRFEPKVLGVSEEHITKALTRPAQWKFPNDHALMRKMQITATPVVLGDSALARLIRQMAESVHGKPAAPEPEKEKKKGFSLFG